ncbi:MAG: DciA family protein, partial [Candidatus Altimarinota bacterium]
ISFSDHTLILGATASTWMHHLSTKKTLIQQGLNQKFGQETVKKVIVKIKLPPLSSENAN